MTKEHKLEETFNRVLENQQILAGPDNNEIPITEAKWSRVASIFRGGYPNIRSAAILTAWNPNSTKQTDEKNREDNKKLERELNVANFHFLKLKGSYGDPEESYIIYDILEHEALKYGKAYNQHSIIFAEPTGWNGQKGFTFKLIECKIQTVLAIRHIMNRVDGDTNFYSEIPDGRLSNPKFRIPFYDNDSYPNLQGSFNKLSKEVKEAIAKYQDTIFSGTVDGKTRWQYRGYIRIAINEGRVPL